jgi:hypothetical protein
MSMPMKGERCETAKDLRLSETGGVPGGGEGRSDRAVSPYGRYDVKPRHFQKIIFILNFLEIARYNPGYDY